MQEGTADPYDKASYYYEFPYSLKVQWGIEPLINNSAGVVVIFPVTFSYVPFVTKTCITPSGNNPTYSYVSVWDVTKHGFRWNGPNVPQMWLAVGF